MPETITAVVSEEQKRLVRIAAAYLGVTLSDFSRDAIMERAEQVRADWLASLDGEGERDD